jgi:hypothetical protein
MMGQHDDMILPMSHPGGYGQPQSMPVSWKIRRDGLWYRGAKRPSFKHSLLATRTSLTLSSVTSLSNGAFASLIPVEMRVRCPRTLRFSLGENASLTSLTFGYTNTASSTWSDWQPVHRMWYEGIKMFAQHPAGGSCPFEYEIRCAKRGLTP